MVVTENIEKANLITHSGVFHADDVFATAFLSKIIENPVVYRLNNYNDDIKTNAIVYDIGGGKFDHHQLGAKVRKEGFKYSSFGLLWEEYGKDYLSKLNVSDVLYVFNIIDNNLAKQIDAIDNGVFPFNDSDYKITTLSDIIAMFNPNYDSDVKREDAFVKAVEFASNIFDTELNKAISKIKAREIINEAIEKSDCTTIYLDIYVPFKEYIFDSLNPKSETLKFIVFPSERGGFTIYTLPTSKKDKTPRLSFPESLRGLREKELREVSKIESAIFVHPAGFIGAVGTIDDAKILIDNIINNRYNEKEGK